MALEVIYGNNGAGKSYFKSLKQEKNALVLTSRLSDWCDEEIFERVEKIKMGQNIRFIKKRKKEFIDKIMKTPKPENISANSYKKMLENSYGEKKITSYKSWLNDKTYNESGLSISEIAVVADLSTYIIGLNLDQKKINKIKDYLKAADKIAKAKRKPIKNFCDDDSLQKSFNNFLEIFNKLKEEILNFKIDETKLDKLNFKIFELIITTKNSNNSIEYFDALMTYVASKLDKNILRQKANEIKNLKENRLKFNTNIKKDNFNIALNFNFLENNQMIEITSSKPLSSGQITLLAIRLILESTFPSRDIILDDVLETLDNKNRAIAIDIIAKLSKTYEEQNIIILTHDTQVVDAIYAIQKEHYDIEQGVKEITYVIGEKPKISKYTRILTWNQLIPQIWDASTERKKYEYAIAKGLSRYIAKISSIHTSKNLLPVQENSKNSKESTIKNSENFKHWKWFSNNFFHYNNSIPLMEIEEYFFFLKSDEEFKKKYKKNVDSVDSIEFIELLEKINNNSEKEEKISKKKLSKLFEKLIIGLRCEKIFFNNYHEKLKNSKYWLTNKAKAYNIVARGNNIKICREKYLIHTLDISPEKITI